MYPLNDLNIAMTLVVELLSLVLKIWTTTTTTTTTVMMVKWEILSKAVWMMMLVNAVHPLLQ
jgi:hypothetical protein